MIVGKRSLKLVWHALRELNREHNKKHAQDPDLNLNNCRIFFADCLKGAPEDKETWFVELPAEFQEPVARALTRIRVMQTAAEMLGQMDQYEEDVEEAWNSGGWK